MWTVRAAVVAAALILSPEGMGSGPQPALAATAAESTDALHEVSAGDDLHLIAGYYYGDARQWPRIWKANPDLIKNPNRIQRGSVLRVPNATVPAESYADFMARVRPRLSAASGASATSASPSSGAAPSALQPPTTPAGQSPSPPPPRKAEPRM